MRNFPVTLLNALEGLVAEAARCGKDEGHSPGFSCWCRVCQADISALALNALPPLYCTERTEETAHADAVSRQIDEEVRRAAERVEHFPHDGHGECTDEQVQVVNLNLLEGSCIVDALVAEKAIPCSCERCRADILAFALNRLPPSYLVERNGVLDIPDWKRDTLRSEIAIMIALASGIVAGRPRHRRPVHPD